MSGSTLVVFRFGASRSIPTTTDSIPSCSATALTNVTSWSLLPPPTRNTIRQNPITVAYFIVYVTDRNLGRESAGAHPVSWRPVLMVEVIPCTGFESEYDRLKADLSIRKRYATFLAACPLPVLPALSIMGRQTRVYRADRAKYTIIDPPHVEPKEHCLLPQDFLLHAWDVDITSPKGFARMKELVLYIKQELTNLRQPPKKKSVMLTLPERRKSL